MQKFAKILAVATLALSTVNAHAAVEVQEQDFGPQYGSMVADAWVGKPLQAISATLGTITYAVSLPFTTVSGDAERARQKLVVEPWDALKRCLGCSVPYDRYERNLSWNDEFERTTISDRPALVEHDDRVVQH